MKLIKSFYLKYPQFRWITFRDMRGLPEHEFASLLEDSFVSVWIDDVSSFGTFPLESMKTGTPVIGKIPNIKPYWMNENNGIWVNDILSMVDVLAEFVQNWLEDNISEKLYESGFKTSNKYSNPEVFESLVVSTFNDYINKRLDNFKTQLEKIKEQ
jgi:glycosyltransferase involved in cell wall biosynthesis